MSLRHATRLGASRSKLSCKLISRSLKEYIFAMSRSKDGTEQEQQQQQEVKVKFTYPSVNLLGGNMTTWFRELHQSVALNKNVK